MKIAAFHNYYQQLGGEDILYDDETALLESRGHILKCFTRHNNEIGGAIGLLLTTAAGTVWNRNSYKTIKSLIKDAQPDVAHFYNTFPLISPAAYYAARAIKVPVVQSLQNYRLLCPGAFFYRNGQVCEECLEKTLLWPGLWHGCYRDSRVASAMVAILLTTHRILGTWREAVDMYIAPTDFARRKFIEGGLPGERIAVKPNFINSNPAPGGGKGRFALFVGRLSKEKGIKTLLAAWERLGNGFPLKVVGGGPLAGELRKAIFRNPAIEYLGHKPVYEVLAIMGEASVLVFPSEWYEGLPRTIIEAFAKGTPVLASNLGAMESVVEHGRTGLHFDPGDPEDLAAKVEWAFTHPKEISQMRREARSEFEAKYTAEKNYEMLMKIYRLAVDRVAGGR